MRNVGPASVPHLNPDCKWREYLKGIVIEPKLALNETAAAIFRLIDGKRTLADISQEVSKRYKDATEQQLQKDAIDLIERLEEEEVIVFG